MKYGCIGERLPYSFSKEIHAELGDYEYEIREIAPDDLDAFAEVADFQAINVTIPYKERMLPHLAELDEGARAVGAVNTVVNRGGRLFGYNTDIYGMTKLFEHAGIDARGRRAAILGSGGTAKTARAVLTRLGASEIVTVGRRETENTIGYERLAAEHRDIDIIVNTTPLGTFPDVRVTAAVEFGAFPKLAGVIDAVYNPLRSALVLEARRLGLRAEGGLYMLVGQAVRASEIFFDRRYPEGTLEEVYQKVLLRKENLVLVGMPSSGKSTLGAELARRLGREFCDTDTVVEERTGLTVGEIFARHGEARFREEESAAIRELSVRTGLVIATGGGAVLNADNVTELKRNGRLIFLERDLDELTPTDTRPLTSDREALKRKYAERLPVYRACADMTVRVEGLPAELAKKTIERLFNE